MTKCLEIAFYIDKKGRRIRPDWIINWEGHPTAFAFRYPYILAFDSSFIEIRHVNTVSCSPMSFQKLHDFLTYHSRAI